MKKRVFSIVTALALCLSLLPGTAWAADPDNGEEEPILNLDLSNLDTDLGDLDTVGYFWDADSKTLTLRDVDITGTVTLPTDAAVKIVTEEGTESRINELLFSGVYRCNITFEGKGELTIDGGLSHGTDGDTLTVAEGANVTVIGRISIGASGGVNGFVNVYGTLYVTYMEMSAIYTGKVLIGSEGELHVSGNSVTVNGGSDGDFASAFKIEGNGVFTSDYDGIAIRVSAGAADETFSEDNVREVIDIPRWDYLPDGTKVELTEAGNEINISGPAPFTVSAANVHYTVSVIASAGGSASASETSARAGTRVDLTASTSDGYIFTGWSSSNVSIANAGSTSAYFIMPAGDVVVTAVWEKEDPEYSITVEMDPEAAGTALASEARARAGTRVDLTASTSDGYVFTGWSSSDVSIINAGSTSAYFIMPAGDVVVTAHWEKEDPEYPITVKTDPEAGTAYATPDSARESTEITLTAEANEGYYFVGWTSEDGIGFADATSAGTTFLMPGKAVTVTANWKEDPEYPITVETDPEAGTASATPDSAREGTEITLTAEANEGYHFVGWTSEDGIEFADEASAGTTFLMPGKAVTVTANWEEDVIPDEPDPPGTPDYGVPSNSGKSSVVTYPIRVEVTGSGTASANPRSAAKGRTITLTVNPGAGYTLDTLTASGSEEDEIRLAVQDNGRYTFTMPGSAVTVKAVFKPLADTAERSDTSGTVGFTDIGGAGVWYHDAVDYVLRKGLMNGYSSTLFGPDDALSRAQLSQILYNKEGKPAVTGGSAFTDAVSGQWYTSAVTWAAASGIAGGYGDGRFGPDDDITREQLAVMLWRYAGSPAATEAELHFSDADKVSGYALDALRWAVENGIINGTGDGQLDPGGLATRAQVAQMLMNFIEGK